MSDQILLSSLHCIDITATYKQGELKNLEALILLTRGVMVNDRKSIILLTRGVMVVKTRTFFEVDQTYGAPCCLMTIL